MHADGARKRRSGYVCLGVLVMLNTVLVCGLVACTLGVRSSQALSDPSPRPAPACPGTVTVASGWQSWVGWGGWRHAPPRWGSGRCGGAPSEKLLGRGGGTIHTHAYARPATPPAPALCPARSSACRIGSWAGRRGDFKTTFLTPVWPNEPTKLAPGVAPALDPDLKNLC